MIKPELPSIVAGRSTSITAPSASVPRGPVCLVAGTMERYPDDLGRTGTIQGEFGLLKKDDPSGLPLAVLEDDRLSGTKFLTTCALCHTAKIGIRGLMVWVRETGDSMPSITRSWGCGAPRLHAEHWWGR